MIAMSMVWPLHVAAMAAFFAMMINLVAKQKRDRSRSKWHWIYTGWRESASVQRRVLREIARSVPLVVRLICVAVFIYVGINFTLSLKNLEGGGPQARNGHYYLESHGHIMRELTSEEYRRFSTYELRLFSGHWIFFALIPAVYFAWGYRLNSPREPKKHG
jgi:hypothetical protein